MIKNYFAKNLRYLLRRDGYTQKMFAEEFDYNHRTVSSWVVGRTQPSYTTLVEISYFFDVTIDELLKVNMEELYNEREERNV